MAPQYLIVVICVTEDSELFMASHYKIIVINATVLRPICERLTDGRRAFRGR